MQQDTDESKIVERVNKSGFPLQMALEHHVRAGRTGWSVATREHHWMNARTAQEGSIDLVLEKRHSVLVIECKRALGARWAFLIEKTRIGEESKCRVVQNEHIIYKSSGNSRNRTTVNEIRLAPSGFESEYCVGAGESTGTSRELLENTAATTLAATEAIARSREGYVSEAHPVRSYYTAIVTTAELYGVFVDSSATSLADGKVSEAITKSVPHIRFVKQLWSGENYPTMEHSGALLSAEANAALHTVLIINASQFLNFLRDFAPDGEDRDELA